MAGALSNRDNHDCSPEAEVTGHLNGTGEMAGHHANSAHQPMNSDEGSPPSAWGISTMLKLAYRSCVVIVAVQSQFKHAFKGEDERDTTNVFVWTQHLEFSLHQFRHGPAVSWFWPGSGLD